MSHQNSLLPMNNSALIKTLWSDCEQLLTQHGHIDIMGFKGSARAWWLAHASSTLQRPIWVITPSLSESEALYRQIKRFSPQLAVYWLPHWDTAPYDHFSPKANLMGNRLASMHALHQGNVAICVTTPQACMQGTIPFEELAKHCLHVSVGEQMNREQLLQRLIEASYIRVDQVESPGEFSVRGEIIDCFSPQYEQPLRIDFFDNEIETLRWFATDTQSSTASTIEQLLVPASESILTSSALEQARGEAVQLKVHLSKETYRELWRHVEKGIPFAAQEQLLPLFYPQLSWPQQGAAADTIWILDNPDGLWENATQFEQEIFEEYQQARAEEGITFDSERFYWQASQWKKWLQSQAHVIHADLFADQSDEGSSGKHPLFSLPFLGTEAIRRIQSHPLTQKKSKEDQSIENNAGSSGSNQDAASQQEGNSAADSMNGMSAVETRLRPSTISPHQRFLSVIEAVTNWWKHGALVIIGSNSDTSAERLKRLLNEHDLSPLIVDAQGLDNLWAMPLTNSNGKHWDIYIAPNAPNEGFQLLDKQGNTTFALITETDLGLNSDTSSHQPRSTRRAVNAMDSMHPGDLVVHVEYGVGKYQGLRSLDLGGGVSDFLELVYAGNDKVYVPVYHFDRVQKYVSASVGTGSLSRLGDDRWQRSRAQAAKAAGDMAEELISLQAARMTEAGYSCTVDPVEMAAFEAGFPYTLTSSQQAAWADTAQDLQAEQPMDRLICGDAGFGKTEIAMRAAWVMIQNNMQTLMLAPTTLLVNQHCHTLQSRFSVLGARVESLSRLVPAKQQKEIIKDFAQGKIDILVGTHRLLSKEVKPAQLGLVVIDEEQRFGLAHKEKMKQRKLNVDVLTLSATPIPRTLQMALTGMRELSVLDTPPVDRLAIRIRVVKFQDYIIREAIEREMRRNGQVFIVHNDVQSIHQFGQYLSTLLPEMTLGIAHGQMPQAALESVMLRFLKKEIKVLLASTIIEAGLDIPNANSIIIHQANRFGLTQLYQLCGRVGRSSRQGYAYLLVSDEANLSEIASKRLRLLQDLNDLGAGFQIAAHDMELRGAGDLLGRAQSGHINKVGLELFVKMLEIAVAERKNRSALPPAKEAKVAIGFNGNLPEEWIPSAGQRLSLYKNLAEVKDKTALWQIQQQMEDRFGPLPKEAKMLLDVIRVRLLALDWGLETVESKKGQLVIKPYPDCQLDNMRLVNWLSEYRANATFTPDGMLWLGKMPDNPLAVLNKLQTLSTCLKETDSESNAL